MSIKGFEVGGVQAKYDYESLDNIPANLVQDANYVHTDNNYTNADKTKLSGIEAQANKTTIDATLTHSGQAADAKATGDAISALNAQVIASMPHDTASGSIASFPDGAAMPVRDLSVAVAPNQNLNGYDNPWPAGGGVNILPPCSIDKASDPQITNDGLGSYTINGTATGYGQTVANESFFLDAGTYTLFSNTGASNKLGVQLRSANGTTTYAASFSEAASFTLAERTEVKFRIVFYAGTFNTTISPTLNKGSSVLPFSPYSNICPISGWTECKVTRTGKNIYPWEGVNYEASSSRTTYLAPGNYILSTDNGGSLAADCAIYIGCFDANGNNITEGAITGTYFSLNGAKTYYYGSSHSQFPFSINKGGLYSFGFNNSKPSNINGLLLELGSTATAYEPYQGQTYNIDLDGTRYGGTLDVTTGKLTVDRAMVDLGSFGWVKSSGTYGGFYATSAFYYRWASDTKMLCSRYKFDGVRVSASYFGDNGTLTAYYREDVFPPVYEIYIKDESLANKTASEFKTEMSGVQLVYELATPIVYDLTPTELTTLLGTNNIFADCGDSTVDYYADPTLYISKKIAAAVAAMS